MTKTTTQAARVQGTQATKSASTTTGKQSKGTSSKIIAIVFMVTQMFSRLVPVMDAKGQPMTETYTSKKGEKKQRTVKRREDFPFTFQQSYTAPEGSKVDLKKVAANFGRSMAANLRKIEALKAKDFTPVGRGNFSITKPFHLQIKANERVIFDSETVQAESWTKIHLTGKHGARLEDAILILAGSADEQV